MDRETQPHDMHTTASAADALGLSEEATACEEYRELSRRRFLAMSKTAATGLIAAPAWLPQVVLGNGYKRGGVTPKTLVYIFLRGGPDVMSQITSWTDPWFYMPGYDNGNEQFPNGLRPLTGLNPPTPQALEYPGNPRSLDLGSVNGHGFGINGAYADPDWSQGGFTDRNSLYDPYTFDGDIAFLLPAGSPDSNRSHFQAEQRVEYGTPNQPQNTFTGVLTRYLQLAPSLGGPLRAAALAKNNLVPKLLAFGDKTMAFQEIEDVVFPSDPNTIDPLIRRYLSQTDNPLAANVANTFEVIDLLAQVDTTPHPLAKYNGSEFGNRMLNAAALIKGGVNIECVYTDRTGWDNHADQNPLIGQGGMYDRMKDLSQNLAAFRIDLQQAGLWNDVVVVVQGEFGRQNNWNNSGGTDHGNGGLMTVMGGSVNGGVYSKQFDGVTDGWPGLEPTMLQQLGQHDALPTTIDYRWVLTEIFIKAMGMSQTVVDNFLLATDDEQPPYAYQELGLIN